MLNTLLFLQCGDGGGVCVCVCVGGGGGNRLAMPLVKKIKTGLPALAAGPLLTPIPDL